MPGPVPAPPGPHPLAPTLGGEGKALPYLTPAPLHGACPSPGGGHGLPQGLLASPPHTLRRWGRVF